MNKKISLYLELTKPRIVFMVLVTTLTGFLFACSDDFVDLNLLLKTLMATYFLASGSSVINHHMERKVDALMIRTRTRPLPSGKISPPAALFLGLLLILVGTVLFQIFTNTITTGLAVSAAIIYNLIYTPMKKISWYNTFVGSIPGALPCLWGWTALRNEVNMGGVILFLILFFWQQPHFFSIALMFQDDYRRANLKMLPVVDKTGQKTFLYILLFTLILIPISLLPCALKISGNLYFFGTLILSFSFFLFSVQLTTNNTLKTARSVLLASVFYLPLLLIIIIGDHFL